MCSCFLTNSCDCFFSEFIFIPNSCLSSTEIKNGHTLIDWDFTLAYRNSSTHSNIANLFFFWANYCNSTASCLTCIFFNFSIFFPLHFFYMFLILLFFLLIIFLLVPSYFYTNQPDRFSPFWCFPPHSFPFFVHCLLLLSPL